MSSPHSTVDRLERLAARAWPAPTVEACDGWRLRFGHGVTRRANSVFARVYEGDDVDDSIAEAERKYAAWGVPARFQIAPACAPDDLDARLAARGYVTEAESIVMTANLANEPRPAPPHKVTHAGAVDRAWAKAWWTFDRGETMPDGLMPILEGASGRLTYASIVTPDGWVALGRGGVECGTLGIFMMATHPDHRRRGFGDAILRTLTDWGRRHGARSAYLQVEAGNAAAQSLYAAAGFTEAYRYHYRTRPSDR